jgi:hypothetical protein
VRAPRRCSGQASIFAAFVFVLTWPAARVFDAETQTQPISAAPKFSQSVMFGRESSLILERISFKTSLLSPSRSDHLAENGRNLKDCQMLKQLTLKIAKRPAIE